MSEPVRYDEVCNDWNGEAAGLAPCKDGAWVKWQDYALLKAEVERLTESRDRQVEINDELDDLCTSLKAENARLRASSFVTAVSVEHYARVVKAGDVIARIIAPPAHGPGEYDGEWYAWHNAKAGVLPRQSPTDTPPTAV